MDALIVFIFVCVISLIKMRQTSTEVCTTAQVIKGDAVSVTPEPNLEIGTNLMLRYEPEAFELILKEFNL